MQNKAFMCPLAIIAELAFSGQDVRATLLESGLRSEVVRTAIGGAEYARQAAKSASNPEIVIELHKKQLREQLEAMYRSDPNIFAHRLSFMADDLNHPLNSFSGTRAPSVTLD